MDVYVDSGLDEFCFLLEGIAEPFLFRHTKKVTVNEAEYIALSRTLTFLSNKSLPKDIQINIFSDSQLMVNQLGDLYKCKRPKLIALKTKVLRQIENLRIVGHALNISWIPREENLAGIILEERKYKRKK